MPRRNRSRIAAVLIALGSAAFVPAYAQDQKPAAQSVRPEVGKPVQAAIDLIKSKRGKEALSKVREADAVPDKTPYEGYVIERLRGQAAAAAGDASTAARAFEATAASANTSAAEKIQFLAAASTQYYLAKDYAKAVELATRYSKAGGNDPSVRTVLVQSLYLGNDFSRASHELLVDVQTEESAGRTPREEQLQLLANACLKQHDNAGYGNALEKLVAYYPKRDYWQAVVYSASSRPGVADRLALDLVRLKLATGTMRTANEYMEAAQLSLQAGYPGEAKIFVDGGFAAGLLGTGPDAERHRRLRALTMKSLAEDKPDEDDAQAAASKDGNLLLNSGLNLVMRGQPDKGLAMMEQGLRKGGLKRPDDARLHLGYAYHLAGQRQKAIQAFKSLQGSDGAAALGRLWVIHLGHAS